MKKRTAQLIASLSLIVLPGAYADDSHHAAAAKPKATTAINTSDLADGEVRKIDKASNKITLKHGEIKNLEMPGMTMVFRVKDAALLDKVQAGDKVKFKAERVNGAFFVTDIELVK